MPRIGTDLALEADLLGVVRLGAALAVNVLWWTDVEILLGGDDHPTVLTLKALVMPVLAAAGHL